MGWPSVAWGLNRISSKELLDWEVYLALEPQGFEIENYRHGQLLSLIANANRDPEKRRSPYLPQEFMYKYQPPKEEEIEIPQREEIEVKTEEEWRVIQRNAKLWTIALGGKIT